MKLQIQNPTQKKGTMPHPPLLFTQNLEYGSSVEKKNPKEPHSHVVAVSSSITTSLKATEGRKLNPIFLLLKLFVLH